MQQTSTMRRSSRCHVHCSQLAFTSLALLLLSSFLSFSPTTTAAASSNGSKKNNNSTQVSYYCGSNWTDASRNCHEACPSGRDDECSQRSWRCFFHTGCDETDSKDNMMLLLPGREEIFLAKENETSTSPLNVEDPEDSHSKTPAADNFANQSLQTLVSEVLLSLSGLESEMSEAEVGLLEETVFQFLERSLNQSGISLKTVAVSRQRVYGEGERRMEARRWMNTPTNNRFYVENGHFDSSDEVNQIREIGSSSFDASQPHSKIQQSISPNSFQAVREPFQESKNYHQQSKTRQLPLSSSALDVNVVITGEYTPPPFLDMTSIATDSINRDSAQIVSDLRSRGSRNGSDFFERLQQVKSTSAKVITPRPTIPSIALPSSAPALVGVTKQPTIHPVQPTIIVDEEQMETVKPSMDPTRKPKGEGEEGEENNITEENGIILDTNFILTLQNVPDVVMNERETQKYQDVLLGYLRNQSALIELDVDVTSVEVWHQILSTDKKEREEKGGKNKSNNVSSTKKYRSKSRNLKVITDQFSYNSTHSQELPPDPTRVDVEITTVVKSSNKPHLPPYVASILILNTMVSSTTNENKNEATFVDSLRAEQLFYSYFKDVDGISIRLIDQVTIPPTSTPTTLEYYTSSVHSLNSIEGSSSGKRNSTPSKNIYVAAALGIAVLWCVLTIVSLSHVRKARNKMMNESILRARRKGEEMAGCDDDDHCRDIERGTNFAGIICEGMEDAIANESNCIGGIISGDDNEGTKDSHGQRLEERSNNVILHQSPPICRTSSLHPPERNCHRASSRNLSKKQEGAFTRGSLATTNSIRSLSRRSHDNSSCCEACITGTENDGLLLDLMTNMSRTSEMKVEKPGHVRTERRRRSKVSILLDQKMREKMTRNLLGALGSMDSSTSLGTSCEGSADVIPRVSSFRSPNGFKRSRLVRMNASRNDTMVITETSSDEGSKEDFSKEKSPPAEKNQDVARSSRGQRRGSKKTTHRDSLGRMGSTRKSICNEEISHDHSLDDGFKTGSIPNMIITTTSDEKDSTFFVTPANLHGADTVNKRTSDTSLFTKTAGDAQGRRPLSRSKSALVGDQRDPLKWIDDIIEKSQNEPRLNSRRKARRSSQQ